MRTEPDRARAEEPPFEWISHGSATDRVHHEPEDFATALEDDGRPEQDSPAQRHDLNPHEAHTGRPAGRPPSQPVDHPAAGDQAAIDRRKQFAAISGVAAVLGLAGLLSPSLAVAATPLALVFVPLLGLSVALFVSGHAWIVRLATAVVGVTIPMIALVPLWPRLPPGVRVPTSDPAPMVLWSVSIAVLLVVGALRAPWRAWQSGRYP